MGQPVLCFTLDKTQTDLRNIHPATPTFSINSDDDVILDSVCMSSSSKFSKTACMLIERLHRDRQDYGMHSKVSRMSTECLNATRSLTYSCRPHTKKSHNCKNQTTTKMFLPLSQSHRNTNIFHPENFFVR